ncbi:ATP-binding protein [Rubrivivax gelatinosus]|uniref:Uncharacterized protein n=1 Tax=Rubrivivax gelatinosus TaxID=28068 RepID=A0A4R2MBG1_RUBGE|nr:ATP-binding protein [Rubrivivax gelatinosus]TCO99875.1 hypothetical protein EV684_114172 [Rubrivivax gelatinosus]
MHDFRLVNWGPDEAKDDHDLPGYFVAFPEFADIEAGQIRYVVGRKGTGKTAIIERIKQRVAADAMGFSSNLTLRNFPLQDFRELRDRSQRDKSQFVAAWSFLLLIELAKMVCSDNGAETASAVDELRQFLSANGLDSSAGFASTITSLTKAESKVKVSTGWLDGERLGGSQTQITLPVHYQKVVGALAARLVNVSSESEYWLFIDELDEGYRAGDTSLRLVLLGLFRAVEDLALSLRAAHFHFRPLVVLRSDIFDRLEDNDLNKLDDYVYRLGWTTREEMDDYALKLVPEARIVKSIPGAVLDPWGHVVVNFDGDLPQYVESVWAFMTSRTYDRPRDIIKFLKSCRKHTKSGQLPFSSVRLAEDTYSDWLFREIRDEIHSYLPCWREATQCITRIGTGRFSVTNFLDTLKEDKTVSKWISEGGNSAEAVVETLYEFGVLGNYDGRRWLFKYKDQDLTWNPAMELIVHFGLCKKLRVTRSF